MNKLVINSFLALSLCLSTSFAGVKKVASFVKKSDGSNSKLIAYLNAKSDIKNLEFQIFESDGELDSKVRVSPGEAVEGKTLLSKMGVKILQIKCDNFATQNGGDCNLKYLKSYSLLAGSKYSREAINLERLGDEWVVSKDSKKVAKIIFHDHSSGIDRLEFIFEN